MAEYKPNSNRYKKELQKNQDRRVEKVAQGKVRRKKKSKASRLKDIFISEDVEDVKSYIIMDVIVPTAKNTIIDVVNMLLYGDTVKRKNSTGVSYNTIRSSSNRNNRRNTSRVNRYDFDDIYFDTRGEVERILDRMDDLLDTYNAVTVADFYELAGVTVNPTDYNYGWVNLSRASIQRTREGYIINLPRVVAID